MRRTVAASALRDGVELALAPMLEKLLCSATFQTQGSVVELVKSMMFGTPASTIAWAQLAMIDREDFTSRMKMWDLPVTCIGGAMDSICPPTVIEQMCSAIPNAKKVISSHSAHLTPLECPKEFAEILRMK